MTSHQDELVAPARGGVGGRSAATVSLARAAAMVVLVATIMFDDDPTALTVVAGAALATSGGAIAWATYRRLVTTGELPALAAFHDGIAAATIVVIKPELYQWVVLGLTGVVSMLAAGFPRQLARRVTMGLVVAFGAIGAGLQPPSWLPSFAALATVSALGMWVISSLRDTDLALRGSHEQLLGHVGAAVWEGHPSGTVRWLGEPGAAKLQTLGLSVDGPGAWLGRVHPDDRQRWAVAVARSNESPVDIEYRMIADDGSIAWVYHASRPAPGGCRGVLIDVTPQRHSEERAAQMATVIDHLPLPCLLVGAGDGESARLDVDALGRADQLVILDANQAAQRRFASLELADPYPTLNEWAASANLQSLVERVEDALRAKQPVSLPTWRTLDGTAVYTIDLVPIGDALVAIALQDMTDVVHQADQLEYQATHDSLTGLPNRTALHSYLGRSQRIGQDVALLYMDLNQFKEVNDALGHQHGDALLIEMGRRLAELTPPGALGARLGGDEFALAVPDIDPAGAQKLAKRVADAFGAPVAINGMTLQTHVSVGVASMTETPLDPSELLRRADVAMFTAKGGGVGVRSYDPSTDRSSVDRLALISELGTAFARHEIIAHYQPLLDLHTGRTTRFEALARWDHPQRGVLPPNDFVELIEVAGRVRDLALSILRAALVDMRTLDAQGHHIGMAINLSMRNLYDPELVALVRSAAVDAGIDPSRLTFEITETELMDDRGRALAVLAELRDLGCSIAIDDFGTGYSSLAYLRQLPATELKIDRTFVSQLRRGDELIVRSIVELGHNLGLNVVAEGVEDRDVLDSLIDMGVDAVQGFLIARPLPPGSLGGHLRSEAQRLGLADRGPTLNAFTNEVAS